MESFVFWVGEKLSWEYTCHCFVCLCRSNRTQACYLGYLPWRQPHCPFKLSSAVIFKRWCCLGFFAVQRNVKKQEELAQEKKLLAEAITELKHTEEEKYARYFFFSMPWVHSIADQCFKLVERLILIFIYFKSTGWALFCSERLCHCAACYLQTAQQQLC